MMQATLRTRALIKGLTPPYAYALLRKLFRRPDPFVQFTGPHTTWQDAVAASSGYDSREIFDAVAASALKVKAGAGAYERDSVVFPTIQYAWPTLAALLWIASRENGRLSVCDFGGALGASYFQTTTFLSEFPDVRWNIVEQPGFVARGRQLFQDPRLAFYDSVDACLSEHPCNVLLLSGVLHYLEQPHTAMADLIGRRFKYILLDRMPLIGGVDDVLTVQHVPPEIYAASFPAWFFAERKLMALFDGRYRLIESFDAIDRLMLGEKLVQTKGFIFLGAD